MAIQRKGILQSGNQVRISQSLHDEMNAMAAEQGNVIPPIKTTDDFLAATLATMDDEMLAQIEAIFDELSAKYAGEE
jgi:hypothetical protein